MPLAKCGHAISYGSPGIRGCCRNCYNRLKSLIDAGKATWEQLEAEGKCGPLAAKCHPLTGRCERGVRK